MRIIDRFDQYMVYRNLNDNRVTVQLGLSNGVIGKSRREGRDLSPKVVEKILETYQDLSRNWLISGQGEMIVGENTADKGEGIPFYDIDLTASYVEAFQDAPEEPSYMIDFAPVNDCTAAFPVYGESMAPGISSGDIVFVREIRNKVSLLWGEVYLVITDATCDNMRTIKRVYLSEDGKTYILRADNPLYAGDTMVPVESVVRIYIVKGSFTRKQL